MAEIQKGLHGRVQFRVPTTRSQTEPARMDREARRNAVMAELPDVIAIVDRPDGPHGPRRSTVANAIHSTSAGDTLASVSRAYDAIEGPTGDVRDDDLEKVCHAIRSATPALPAHLSDADPLPAGTILFIPTLRELNRVVFTENARLLADMRARGFHHAGTLLRCTSRSGRAGPPPPSRRLFGERRRACLDAHRAAESGRHGPVHGQAPVRRRGHHDARRTGGPEPGHARSHPGHLVAPPHSRPAALAKQGHGKRWRLAARSQVRKISIDR